MSGHRLTAASVLALSLGSLFAMPVSAQNATGGAAVAKTVDAGPVEEPDIVVTGSRFGARIAVDSPTPIDSITADELASGGETELQNMLRIDVPSFNTARPVAAGVANFLRSPTW